MEAVNTKTITSILAENGIQVNKKLGQNFLCNDTVVEKILSASAVTGGDRVLEVGPGLGALTERLAERAGHVTAVEIDSGLARYLHTRFADTAACTVIHGDFLRIHCEGEFTRAVSNLPYYCASEILFRLATEYRMPVFFVMMQHEMAERIQSGPGTKEYGALGASLALYYRGEYLFGIDKTSFYPKPEVRSAFMKFSRRDDVPENEKVREMFHRIVKSAFWGRRKTVLKSLTDAPHLDYSREEISDVLRQQGIDPSLRGENLGVEDFRGLAEAFVRRSGN